MTIRHKGTVHRRHGRSWLVVVALVGGVGLVAPAAQAATPASSRVALVGAGQTDDDLSSGDALGDPDVVKPASAAAAAAYEAAAEAAEFETSSADAELEATYDGAETAAQAAAVKHPARGDSKARPVIFVHGISHNEKTDCRLNWAKAGAAFRKDGFTGKLETFGYYKNNKNCSAKYNGNLNTDLSTVAKAFANWVYKTYTKPKKPVAVDVVAHSMGGLIVRAAIHGVQSKKKGFPPRLYIEDVVTMSTPHDGAVLGSLCGTFVGKKQCEQMDSTNPFLKDLNKNAKNPQSTIGTDWSTIGSEKDLIVLYDSAKYMAAGHKYTYRWSAGLGHSGIIVHDSRAGGFDVDWEHAETKKSGVNLDASASLYIAAAACHRWRAW